MLGGAEKKSTCPRPAHRDRCSKITPLTPHHFNSKTAPRTAFPAPRYHAIGRPQSEDVFLWDVPEHPTWHLGAEVTDDGNVS